MSYCLGIKTAHGLVMASDSRASAGVDQVNVCRKMHLFVTPGERVLTLLTTGSLSLSQSVITLLRNDFDDGKGLAETPTLYEAVRLVGKTVRQVSDLDREALEKDDFRFNVHLLVGGQIRGERSDLYMVYPQGNPLRATRDSPYLQIGETKYGRPILDRGIRYDEITLEEAAKYALISLDSTMRSNLTVGPPVDILVYTEDELDITRYRRFYPKDPDLIEAHTKWEQSLRRAVQEQPDIRFGKVEEPIF